MHRRTSPKSYGTGRGSQSANSGRSLVRDEFWRHFLNNRDTIAANTGDGELDKLVAKYARMVVTIAAKYRLSHDDEALQEGLLGIVDAHARFRKRRGQKRSSSFTTFCWWCVRGRIVAYGKSNLRRTHRDIYGMKCVAPVAHLHAKIHPEIDQLIDDEAAAVELQNAKAEASELLSECTPLERKVVDLYYFQGLTHSRIAKRLKISQSYSSLIICTVLDRLRSKYGPVRAPAKRNAA
jgi:RNA polymerase sigma factor (sigma-70 family)